MNTELVFLGTGTSHGIPMIGCSCGVCRSGDSRDRRNRAAAFLRTGAGRVILIDAPPELRLAAVATGLERVDAILFTHAHADHIMGLDDVRRFNDIVRAAIPCYGNAPALERLARVFDYAAMPYDLCHSDRPSLRWELLEAPADIAGLTVEPVPLLHGPLEVLGFRIAGFAYCTDVSEIPPASWKRLEGLGLLVLDALRRTPHPTHFNLEQALEVVARLRPRRTLLTHITHELAHEATNRSLPPNVELAYDGLRLALDL